MSQDLKTLIEKKFEFKKDFYETVLNILYLPALRSMMSRGQAKDLAMDLVNDQHSKMKQEILPVLLEMAEELKRIESHQIISIDKQYLLIQIEGYREVAKRALAFLQKWAESKNG